MAKSSQPVMSRGPRMECVSIATANTNRDGTGTIGTLATAHATNGSWIDNIVIQAAGTTTAGVVRIYIYDGTNYFLFWEQMVTAITPSATVQAFNAKLDFSQPGSKLWLPAGYSIRVSTHNAETFKVHCQIVDY